MVAKALLSVDFGEDAFVGLGVELVPCGPENVDDRTGWVFGCDGLGLTDFTGVTGCDTADFGGGGLEAGKNKTKQILQCFVKWRQCFYGLTFSVTPIFHCHQISKYRKQFGRTQS